MEVFGATATGLAEGSWDRCSRRLPPNSTVHSDGDGVAFQRKKKTSFKETRELTLLCYAENLLSDDEFLVLWENNQSSKPDFPWDSYGPFDLENIDEAECKAEFRVEKRDLPTLREVLGIPPTFKCPQRTICDGMEGLCMLLKRLAYPCRYSDMIARFGRPVPELCMITNRVMDFIYDAHGHRITQWNDTILNPRLLEQYATVITEKGAALDNCFGFIDGTVRPISKPGDMQRIVYNGHKRVHALKFQSVAIPNGLIANMFGPVGKCH